ncbi:MAG: hypothetical protein WBM86_30005 [Waterburya sp.]
MTPLRLNKAELALEKLVQKPPQDELILQTKVESILKRYRLKEQIITSIEKKISYQKVYQGAGRGGENREKIPNGFYNLKELRSQNKVA